MKLPFSIILGPILKTYFRSSKVFCRHYAFSVSVPYTYIFSALGLVSLRFLKRIFNYYPLIRFTDVDVNTKNLYVLYFFLQDKKTNLKTLDTICGERAFFVFNLILHILKNCLFLKKINIYLFLQMVKNEK